MYINRHILYNQGKRKNKLGAIVTFKNKENEQVLIKRVNDAYTYDEIYSQIDQLIRENSDHEKTSDG